MSHRRSTVKGSLSFANPTVRAWLFQILAVVAVVGIVGWLFHNTVTNLSNRGITSGFAFLDRGAGFGIVQHLIDYQQGDTYGRVFIVGLLNTLLVSALCIVFASVLGFFIGLARLSDNWLLRKLSTIYIEIFRNIPPLLQIFFWYFAVLRNLPGPRQAVSAFDLAFLSNRGLYIPSPQLGDGFIAFILAVVMAIVLSVGLFRFNKTYQIKTGQLRRTWPIAAVLIIGLPLLAQWLFGAALHWDVPALRGFNFRGGMVLIPELAALTLALSVYTSAFIAEIIRAGIQAVPYGQHEAARSLGLPNPVTLRQVIIPQALRVIIPPLTSQYLNIVKNSSLAAAIGYPDMVSLFAGTVLNWAFLQANWVGSTRADCTKAGACWVFIHERFGQFMYGLYPHDQRWRINLALLIGLVSIAPMFWKILPHRGRYIAAWAVIYPLIVWWLMYGGFFGLERVETRQWGGLTLTLIIASVGIAGALPWGILLALGRRSHMPIVRILSVIFIEFWRGVPLITVLFMSSVMLPLFMAEGTSIDKLIRALVGVILFQSAYVAEVVRGGLQALPKGQYEAAESLALGYWKTQGLVILPQALKLVIPGLVNTIIALFKDTSLVIIIGLFDLFSSVQQATVDPTWLGMSTEGYVFAALIYWIFCFSMSRYSQHLEKRFNTGRTPH